MAGLYVETRIRAPLDVVWRHTQEPALHAQWDLRFSTIEYLPRASEDEPQRFLYATRIGFGLRIAGEGQSVGRRDLDDGGRTSSLTFGSADPRSVIREGSGYWRYMPDGDGVRFLTWYDYRTRGGALGALLDRAAFRPLLGWATAWSFDRLRLWIERGADPQATLRRWLARGAARAVLAFVFAWHGLVPKLLLHHEDEFAPLRDAGVPDDMARTLVVVAGVGEIVLAACIVLLWRRRWPAVVALTLVLALTLGIVVTSPRYLGHAFDPLTLNFAVATLAAVDLLLLGDDLPTASRCLRRPPEDAR